VLRVGDRSQFRFRAELQDGASVRARVFAFLALLLALAAPAAAQGRGTPADFDFYVLTLSWSPAFCDIDGDARNRSQCREGGGTTFVVHGLWPQYERGFPSDCRVDAPVSRQAVEAAGGVFPDEGLARYEWRKHGSCSGLSPMAYFTAVRQAAQSIRIPAMLTSLDQPRTMRVFDIERAFVAENRGLRTDQIAVTCRRGMISEVRVCLSKDLRDFRPCPEVVRSSCRAREIDVEIGLPPVAGPGAGPRLRPAMDTEAVAEEPAELDGFHRHACPPVSATTMQFADQRILRSRRMPSAAAARVMQPCWHVSC
ncbi:MAG: ribonuclease T2, partial [Proteobacteria bacterium]|nr:ribonuclease T2 [Pseudomonadota bacterium]